MADNESILASVKRMIGLEYVSAFDNDLITNINSVFMVLNQLGVGPDNCFAITGDSEVWDDFLGYNEDVNAVKTYMYLKVRLMFDPPTSSVVMDAMSRQINELEWRLNVQVDPGDDE